MTTPENLEDSPALVVVVNDPADLARALDEGWYRIPLTRAPARIGVEHLAFYQTGAFPEGERWLVRWYAPVLDYRIVQRRELIPTEPDHARATDRYYRVDLGAGARLTTPIPSQRLRRITFIPTTLARLLTAREINELWIKSGARERLWLALQQANLEAEFDFEIAENASAYTVDFLLPCRDGLIGVEIEEAQDIALSLHERVGRYPLNSDQRWTWMRVPASSDEKQLERYLAQLKHLIEDLGGLV